jgi:N-acetylglucosamine kinase-like BadF-type ATPase
VTRAAAPILVGVDAGATKTEVLAVRADGELVGRAHGGGANPKRQGLEVAADRIAGLVRMAAGEVSDLTFVAGAGLDRPEHARALEVALAARLAGGRVMAANDTLAALRLGTPDGIGLVVPVSTGGNVVGRGPDGRVTDRGHGVFGGGWVMGALAARAARRGGVSDELSAAVEAARLTWSGRRPDASAGSLGAAVAAAARAGDPFPSRIVERWCRVVTGGVREEAVRLRLGAAPAVVIYGGLLDASPWLGQRIRRAILAGLPDASIRTLEASPVEGAALLARDAWTGRLGSWDFVPRR